MGYGSRAVRDRDRLLVHARVRCRKRRSTRGYAARRCRDPPPRRHPAGQPVDLALQSDSLALSLTVAAIGVGSCGDVCGRPSESLRSGRSPFSGRSHDRLTSCCCRSSSCCCRVTCVAFGSPATRSTLARLRAHRNLGSCQRAQRSRITEFNTYSNLKIRIFGNAEHTNYFVQHGMPVDPAILHFRGVVRRDAYPQVSCSTRASLAGSRSPRWLSPAVNRSFAGCVRRGRPHM